MEGSYSDRRVITKMRVTGGRRFGRGAALLKDPRGVSEAAVSYFFPRVVVFVGVLVLIILQPINRHFTHSSECRT